MLSLQDKEWLFQTFSTKQELRSLEEKIDKKFDDLPTKIDLLRFKDEILTEIIKVQRDLKFSSNRLYNHEDRLQAIEKKLKIKSRDAFLGV